MPGNGDVMPGRHLADAQDGEVLAGHGVLVLPAEEALLDEVVEVGRRGARQAALIEHQRMGVLLQAEQQFLFPLPLLLLAPDRHRHRHEREHDRHRDQQHGHRVASRVRVSRDVCGVPHAFAILGCHASTATPRVVVRSGRSPSGRPWARPSLVLGAALVGCDKAPLTAPTDSAVTLFANQTVVALNGSVEITANVTEPGGVPVQNGTQVNFTTTLGSIEPAEARTSGGRATVRLNAGHGVGRGADPRLFRRRPGRGARDSGRGRGGDRS